MSLHRCTSLADLRHRQLVKQGQSESAALLPRGLTNEEAARRAGFSNRLDWASHKRKAGIAKTATRQGWRYPTR